MDKKKTLLTALLINLCLLVQTSSTKLCSNAIPQNNCFRNINEELSARPQPVNNVSCEVYNWENMTCVLDLGANYRNADSFSVNWDWTVDNNFSPCPHLTTKLLEQKVICEWKRDDGRDSYKGLEYLFKITVGSSLQHDNVTSYIKTQLSVKPAPVENLRVVPDTSNSTALTLAWNHRTRSSSLRYTIHYVSEWNDSICKELFKTDPSTTLTGLQPYTNYTITMSVVPINASGQPVGFCSKPTTITVTTQPDVPANNPKMMPGFFNCLTPSCGEVAVYWMNVPKKDLHGQFNFINVTFLYTNGSGFFEIVRDSSMTSVEMTKICTTCEIRVEIRLRNNVGFSKKNPSYFILFPTSKRPDVRLAKLRVEALSQNKVNMSWTKLTDRNITNYSLCRCYKDTLGTRCAGELRCKIVRRTTSNLTIELDEGTYKDYKFGMSVEKQSRRGAFISSGILWNTCTYLKYGKPTSVPDVKAHPDNEAKAVSISWTTYPCSPDFGPVIGYRITYCRTIQKNCSDIDVGPWDLNYTISDLLFGEYQYMVKGIFKAEGPLGEQYGPSYNGSIVIVSDVEVITQGEVNESSSDSTAIILAVVCASIVGIIIIIISVMKLRKKSEEINEDTKKIEMPEIRKCNTSPKSVKEQHKDSGYRGDSGSNGNDDSPREDTKFLCEPNGIKLDEIRSGGQQSEGKQSEEQQSEDEACIGEKSLPPYLKTSFVSEVNALVNPPPTTGDYTKPEELPALAHNTKSQYPQSLSEECAPLLTKSEPEMTVNLCLRVSADQPNNRYNTPVLHDSSSNPGYSVFADTGENTDSPLSGDSINTNNYDPPPLVTDSLAGDNSLQSCVPEDTNPYMHIACNGVVSKT